jgi:exodeoxyribonuclease III
MSSVIKVATWNVNSLRTRLAHVSAWIEANQPDILCLQETKVEDGLFPTEAFTSLGYHIAMYGQKSYNGVAIASRQPLQDIANGFGAEGLPEIFGSQSRLIAATTCGIRVVSAYVPNGESPTSEKFAFKREFYQHLQAYVQRGLTEYTRYVICGDFNISADERDIENPEKAAKHVLFTPEERGWLADLMSTNGLSDSFREVNAEAGIYSWYDYRTYGRNPNNGARIDYLFTSPALTPHVKHVWHDQGERTKTQPSDHIPVVLELAL